MPTSAHVPLGDSASLASYGVYHQFGCFTTSGGLFKSQLADGIVGLAPRGRFPRFPRPRHVVHRLLPEARARAARLRPSRSPRSARGVRVLLRGGRGFHDAGRRRPRRAAQAALLDALRLHAALLPRGGQRRVPRRAARLPRPRQVERVGVEKGETLTQSRRDYD